MEDSNLPLGVSFFKLGDSITQDLKDTFNYLDNDPNKDYSFRKRRYRSGRLNSQNPMNIDWSYDSNFVQDSKLVEYKREEQRFLPLVSDKTLALIENLLVEILKHIPVQYSANIGVHQIRITCSGENPASHTRRCPSRWI